MNTPPPATERTYLLLAAGGNLLVGVVGLVVSVISSSQAILLDGLFNLTYMATGLFALRVARLVQRGDDARFPAGYAYFEPLVNGIKGTLVLGISLMAMAGAIQGLLAGGREISAGLAVVYGVFATVVCFAMAMVSRSGWKRTESPMLHVDAVNWTINAAISACVLAAFIVIFIIRGTALDGLVPYVDPGLVLLLVLITIAVPVRMAWTALMALLNRAPPADVVSRVQAIVEAGVADLPVQSLAVRVVQPGRTRNVMVHVVLPATHPIEGLAALDAVRDDLAGRLQAEHAGTILDVVFTGDPRWGAAFESAG